MPSSSKIEISPELCPECGHDFLAHEKTLEHGSGGSLDCPVEGCECPLLWTFEIREFESLEAWRDSDY